ncbi:enoyl-CoA hydratase-related protein [Fusobacterium sp. PH5-44]|uniref:enoyl-CoA hydratase-related protein n=1 Tax=unclassified Fusobacterium TaxID=2648384 RepID=UPI003D1C7A1B
MNVNSYENLKVIIEDKIAIITVSRPKALNALNNQTLHELSDCFDKMKDNNDILGIIITGEGKAFVAGADIVQMQNYKSEEGRNYAGYAQSIFNKIESIEKPVIAAINGYALGGGCELSLSCDIRIASDKAIFGQPEVNLGTIPCFGGTQRLTRLIGTGLAKELIYTGRQVKAEEAFRIGLVNKVTEAEDLIEESKRMMMTILEKAPIAIRYAKVAINNGVEMDMNRALELEKDLAGLTFATDDKKEGMDAFVEKRKAIFKNK